MPARPMHCTGVKNVPEKKIKKRYFLKNMAEKMFINVE